MDGTHPRYPLCRSLRKLTVELGHGCVLYVQQSLNDALLSEVECVERVVLKNEDLGVWMYGSAVIVPFNQDNQEEMISIYPGGHFVDNLDN